MDETRKPDKATGLKGNNKTHPRNDPQTHKPVQTPIEQMTSTTKSQRDGSNKRLSQEDVSIKSHSLDFLVTGRVHVFGEVKAQAGVDSVPHLSWQSPCSLLMLLQGLHDQLRTQRQVKPCLCPRLKSKRQKCPSGVRGMKASV